MNDSNINDKPRLILRDNKVVTTSLAVAEYFGKRHADVLRAINNLAADCPVEWYQRNFALVKETIRYIGSDGVARTQETSRTGYYEMTRDGFVLLAMGFTGKTALVWKIRYIDGFNAMERMLTERGEHEIVERVRQELAGEQLIDAAQALREVLDEEKAKLQADAASLTAERIAHSMKIPPWSCEGGYLSEAFMLMFFGLERRFIDAALLWALYDTFGVHLETRTLSARAIVEASGGSLSATSVYLSRQRLIARGLLYGQPQTGRSDWRIQRERFEKMMRDTQLVAHVARVPAVLPEIHGANRKLAKWMEMPAPKAVQ